MRARARHAGGAAALLLLGGCAAAPAPVPAPRAAPPAPPAACLLDGATLAAQSGVPWTPDPATASDTRCVYDAGTGPAGPVFLTVTLAPMSQSDPAAEVEMLAQLCDRGSRAPLTAARGGFVCRFGAGQVLGVLVRGPTTVAVTTSDTPAATTGARVVVAVARQLERLT